MCAVEAADIAVDFEEYGDRVRATMEVHLMVTINCSKRAFEEQGGVGGLMETLRKMIARSLQKSCGMRVKSVMRLVQGSERASC